jgi:hypothetical protein
MLGAAGKSAWLPRLPGPTARFVPDKTVACARRKGLCSRRGQGHATDMASTEQPVTIKRYANERLYNTAPASYLGLGDLAGMVEDEEDFVVTDAKSGEDITRAVLEEIIISERRRHG